VLAVVGLLAALMLITRHDLFYVLVIEWALFGIALKQIAIMQVFVTTLIVWIVVWIIWFAVLGYMIHNRH